MNLQDILDLAHKVKDATCSDAAAEAVVMLCCRRHGWNEAEALKLFRGQTTEEG